MRLIDADKARGGVKMEWNVWRDELNTNKIKPFNVFNHCSFNKAVTDIFFQTLTHGRV